MSVQMSRKMVSFGPIKDVNSLGRACSKTRHSSEIAHRTANSNRQALRRGFAKSTASEGQNQVGMRMAAAKPSRINGRREPDSLRSSRFVIARLFASTMHTLNVLLLLLRLGIWTLANGPLAEAVSVQRLQVPDLVVIEQQLQQPLARVSQPQPWASHSSRLSMDNSSRWAQRDGTPQAASLVNSQQQLQAPPSPQPQPQLQQPLAAGGNLQQITFECLVSFDRKRDKNLIIKWHHDERNEPIYQWIPELNKPPSIAAQYRAYIAPITAAGHQSQPAESNSTLQLLEAGFRLIRPTKELGGKYTCSAISAQNDDSKSKKMIVYTPPRSFKFNVTRADIGALLANQRDRLILMTQPAGQPALSSSQLPLAYRMRGLVEPSQTSQQQQQLMTMAMNGLAATTISPQMYSTIDYVNVNHQQRAWQPAMFSPASAANLRSSQLAGSQLQTATRPTSRQQFGLKLVCDIDQVFPVPEVSIYKRGDSLEPTKKLTKLDTRIERDVSTGLFHVQVISIVDDDELRHHFNSWSSSSPSGEIHFECVIALTNLELSKYGDNKRGVVYRAGQQQAPTLTNGALQVAELDPATRSASSASSCLHLAGSTLFSRLTALILLGSTTLLVALGRHRQIPDH